MNGTTQDLKLADPSTWGTGFYVMDRFATSVVGAYVSGPHGSAGEAERVRRGVNIADDCEVLWHVKGSAAWTEY